MEYQKCRFAKMILHDSCSISYDLAASFRGRRSTLDRWIDGWMDGWIDKIGR